MSSPLQILHESKHLRLVRRDDWEFVQRPKITGIVGIIAVTDDQKLVLVEQFRIPLQKNVIEIPAGLAGDVSGAEHEALAQAAMRELEEETGYRAERMVELTSGASSAGLTDEIITLFRAEGLKKVGPGGGDGSESIVVHEVPVDEVESWLAERVRGGAAVDLKVYSALYFARCGR